MTDVNGVNNFSQLGLGVPKADGTGELGQTDFLELLVAQMGNQNPLEPESNGEFLTQMAQFGTVDGIQKINENFQGLAASLQSNIALQASSLVGRQVTINSNTAFHTAGEALNGQINLDSSASNINIKITNAQGELVRTLPLANQAAGNVEFQWDGKNNSGQDLPGGKYSIQAEGVAAGQVKSFAVNVNANVDSVSLDKNSNTMKLNLRGLDSIEMDKVLKIS